MLISRCRDDVRPRARFDRGLTNFPGAMRKHRYHINPALQRWEEDNYARLMTRKLAGAKAAVAAGAPAVCGAPARAGRARLWVPGQGWLGGTAGDAPRGEGASGSGAAAAHAADGESGPIAGISVAAAAAAAAASAAS